LALVHPWHEKKDDGNRLQTLRFDEKLRQVKNFAFDENFFFVENFFFYENFVFD
jgi:hypothetical protein